MIKTTREMLKWLFVLAREQALATYFGSGNFADTFNVALRLPETLGCELERTRKKRVAKAALIGMACLLLAPLLLRIYAGAFLRVPIKFDLTVQTLQLLFLILPVFAVGALSGTLFHVSSALAVMVLTGFFLPRMAASGVKPIYGMTLGWMAGAFIYGAAQVFRRQKSAARPDRLSATPPALGLAVLFSAAVVSGASWLGYATRAVQIGLGLFRGFRGRSRAIESSSHAAEAARAALADFFPVAAWLAFLALPCARLFFEYGRFTGEDSLHVAALFPCSILAWLAADALHAVERFTSEKADTQWLGLTLGEQWPAYAEAAIFACVGIAFASTLRPEGLVALAAALLWVRLGLRLRVLGAGSRFMTRPLVTRLIFSLAIGLLCWGTHRLFDAGMSEASFLAYFAPSEYAETSRRAVPVLRVVKLALVALEGKFAWELKNKLTSTETLG